MNHYKNKLNKFTKILKQDREILAAFVFGSVARKERHKQSDIDICLLMSLHLSNPLELSQKKLEYLNLFELDIQIFQQLPLYIRMRIIKEGKIFFCRNEAELYRIVFRTITEFNDFKHIYRDYLKEVASAG